MLIALHDLARLPLPDDNVAIAIQQIETGTKILVDDRIITVSNTVLVGHRFAVRDVAIGESLLSWGQTFGIATAFIKAGDYVINTDVLNELRRRSIDIDLPAESNFQNELEHYQFDAEKFTATPALPRYAELRTFMGYRRERGRGVGTRNTIVLLGTSALVAGFVRKLESALQSHIENYPNIDGIVAVAHTEGAHGKPNNEDLLLRTLAGFVVHPNVGAVLIVDYGSEAINNDLLRAYIERENYPLDSVLHQFMRLSESFDDDLDRAKAIVNGWLDAVNAMPRTAQPLSTLKIALQCGGSDAFSGISGNPLAAWVAKEIIQYGGCANLAETDELIGAETYVLDKVRDVATAEKFLAFVARFKERVAWHGHSAEGNPSGGNKFRGLYNIYLKSLGAATKRHPDVRLDYVIDYGEQMQEPGYYFMDSPGNDLESVAGQVASGCNMIFFATGNGSITNFPFVPTIKIVTTTERYELLQKDMDINAGAYLDGTPLEQVGQDTLDYTIAVASGQLSVGEKAGHSQVQIWRDWQLTRPIPLESIRLLNFSGEPITINTDVSVPDVSIDMMLDDGVVASEQVGLILPTSLCSGQIARLCVETLNRHPMREVSAISRFVTLTHTEGCGGSVNPELKQVLLGYLDHPFVKHALLLEHGCEMTHNDYFRNAMKEQGYNAEDYGWASIQLDGGIQSVIQKMVGWFEDRIARESKPEPVKSGLNAVHVAITTQGNMSPDAITTYARLTQMVCAAGGSVVLHENDALLKSAYADQLDIAQGLQPNLDYGQHATQSGFYVMAMPTHDWGEIITGLGGSGVQLMLNHTHQIMHGHPMIPVLQISDSQIADADITLVSHKGIDALLDGIQRTLSGLYTPHAMQADNVNFQITRGILGVSL